QAPCFSARLPFVVSMPPLEYSQPIWEFHAQTSDRIGLSHPLVEEEGYATGCTFSTTASFTSGRLAFPTVTVLSTPNPMWSAAVLRPNIAMPTLNTISTNFGAVFSCDINILLGGSVLQNSFRNTNSNGSWSA